VQPDHRRIFQKKLKQNQGHKNDDNDDIWILLDQVLHKNKRSKKVVLGTIKLLSRNQFTNSDDGL
jgi:hypothetical protein